MPAATAFRPIYTPAMMARAGAVPVGDLLAVCRAASKLALQGDGWGPEDRAECAAHLCTLTLERVERSRREWHPPMRLEPVIADAIPARYCGLNTLVRRAGDWRDSLTSAREREAIDAAARAGATFTPAPLTGDAPEVRGSAHGAYHAAADLLRSSGLLDAGQSPSAGPVWTLAYAAVRASAGLESREIADELELSFSAFRAHLSRGAKAVRYSSPLAWAEALAVPVGGDAHPRVDALPRGERFRPGDTLPNTGAAVPTHPVRESARKPSPLKGVRASWSARYRCAVTGATVDPLRPQTHARLAKATDMRRKRASAQTPEESRRARLAAGLSPTVR